MKLELTLPYPPSANHYKGITCQKGKAKTYLKTKAKQYHNLIQELTINTPTIPPIPTKATIITHPPDNRKRDLGNVEKVLLDSLQRAGILPDDAQINELHIIRSTPKPPYGLVHVTLQTEEVKI
jgi:crossover junction endodeoxyribonuclease RusA